MKSICGKRAHPRYTMLNAEKLIDEVRRQPIIYNKYLKNHRHVGTREAVWAHIASAMNATTIECKRRWRHLRDAFMRHIRQHPSNASDNLARKRWVFYDLMLFLIPYIEMKESQEEKLPNILKFDEINVAEPNSLNNFHDASGTHMDNQLRQDAMNVARLNECELPECKITPADLELADSEQAATNSNEQFLMSCAPILHRLNHKKNALARLKIQQILYDIEFGIK